ncbi:MAG: class I SAM-dependent methyltransferase [Acidobacteriia bacterium]|nr:class I SAM-dependent methyltransferase [Terriglobia bacterium]
MDSAARQQFLEDYARIRHAEGRGSANSAYYRELPDRDLSGRNPEQWRIRARSFHTFERTILADAERRAGRQLDVLDLGAGNGWMSYRLASRGHRAVALDIFRDELDGLGALAHYPLRFPAAAADFDFLPFREAAFDLAIFNSSFHYSSDYRRTLTEVRRCLRAGGSLVIMDSPVYRRSEHGEMMRAERQAYFEQVYGFRSDALKSIEYLDRRMLQELSDELNIEWQYSQPWYGLRWALRPWKAMLRGQRPPSRFLILVARFRDR